MLLHALQVPYGPAAHAVPARAALPGSTVGEVAKAHGIKVETLWMLNAGFDPTGQLPPEELTDKALFFKTLLLQ